MKKIIYSALLFLTAFTMTLSAGLREELFTESNLQEVLEYAQENLSLEGTLMQKPNGYLYLKVDKGYINVLYPLLRLQEKNFIKPNTSAHIGVIFGEELHYHLQLGHPWPIVEEIGQTFHFTLKEIYIRGHPMYGHHAILGVQSPELDAIREKYGFYGFHAKGFEINLGKRFY